MNIATWTKNNNLLLKEVLVEGNLVCIRGVFHWKWQLLVMPQITKLGSGHRI